MKVAGVGATKRKSVREGGRRETERERERERVRAREKAADSGREIASRREREWMVIVRACAIATAERKESLRIWRMPCQVSNWPRQGEIVEEQWKRMRMKVKKCWLCCGLWFLAALLLVFKSYMGSVWSDSWLAGIDRGIWPMLDTFAQVQYLTGTSLLTHWHTFADNV